MINKKQMKIPKMFRAAARQPEEDCDDLEEEVLKLEQTLKEKRDLFFHIQRNKFRSKRAPPKSESKVFVNPQKIIHTNSIDSMKQKVELMSMLSGIEVQSYVADDHCAVLYHLQHDSETEVKHGLMIRIKNGSNIVSNSSLPLGFNLSAVLDSYKNVLQADCLQSIRRALVAYYDRLNQCNVLKKMLNISTQFFKSLDGSHIEITFPAQNDNEENPETITVTIIFDYRVYDIRPSQYDAIIDRDTVIQAYGTKGGRSNERPLFNRELLQLMFNNFTGYIFVEVAEEAGNILGLQCAVFKKKPLHKAFREAFIEGNGPFVMISQEDIDTLPEKRKKRHTKLLKAPNPHYNNDDTFRPEDYSETDDDDVDDN